METHEVTVLNGTIDVSWRANQGNLFYVAEETETGIIILTPAASIPARRKLRIPLRGENLEKDGYGNEKPAKETEFKGISDFMRMIPKGDIQYVFHHYDNDGPRVNVKAEKNTKGWNYEATVTGAVNVHPAVLAA